MSAVHALLAAGEAVAAVREAGRWIGVLTPGEASKVRGLLITTAAQAATQADRCRVIVAKGAGS